MSNPAACALSDLGWEHCFPRNSYLRGLQYATENRVRALQALDASGLHWSASVAGGQRAPYQCRARLTPAAGRGKPRLISTCTCPLGGDCKHIVAMLCTAEWEGDDAPPSAPLPTTAARPADALAGWTQWLERQTTPAAAITGAAGSQAPADFGLLIRAAAYGDPPRLLATMAAFKRGRQGQPAGPVSVPLAGSNPTLAPAGGWPEADQFALNLLLERQIERIGPLSYAPIQGQAQERALEHLLQRYPAYFERAARPLSFGPPLRLGLHWQPLPDGSQRLACAVADSAPLQLLKAEGLWYLDQAGARLGRIEDGQRLYEAARSAPALLPEQAAALRQRLQTSKAPLSIPAPAERAPPRPVVLAPQPVLSLRRFQPTRHAYGARQPSAPVGVARIGFDYGGETFSVGGPDRERRWRDGEVLEILRDRPAEQACLKRWRAQGLLPSSALPWPLSHAFSEADDAHLLLAPDKTRQPQPPEAWADTLRQLQAEGVRLAYEGDFPQPLREIETDDWDAELHAQGNAWFGLSLGINLDGERIDLLPILRQLLADPAFPFTAARGERPDATWRIALDEQRALRLPLEKLRALIAPLLEWLQQDGPLRLHRSQALTVQALAAAVHWRGDQNLRRKLLDLGRRPKAAKAPAGFKTKLRPYQREGLAWLNLLGEAGLGGVLADDMGLGKTVQVLAHLLAERQRREGSHRTLVVAPTSLMGNWRDEAARFAPALKTLVLHGPDRGDRYDEIAGHDLILTTYPLLARDRERLLAHEFDLLVLDEAQAIKNARSQAAQVVRELRASRRLAMTGTPLENHLGELWAQLDAVEPGVLGSERDFTRLYRTPIEKHGDRDRQQGLTRRIGPLLLRRRKDEVLTDLPAKTEIVRLLELDGGQRELYETLRLAQNKRVREAVSKRGLAQSGIVVLDALLKLRQCCCDPRLVKLPAARKVKESAKLDALIELLGTLLDEGRKVLLFSQFTGMLDLVEPALDRRGIDYLRLTGDTPGRARAGIVRRFQDGAAPLFLISLKAGGVGLNLTAADTVIHYDPWWNPAVENQATDRAHRIGQDKPVFVYKLICQGTVEEKILALQARKAELAQAVLEGGRSTRLRFTENDLAELFAPMR